MKLDVKGYTHKQRRNKVDLAQGLPRVVLNNSTIKALNGTFIRLRMFDSLISVETHNITSPVFLLSFSNAEICNCTFHSIQNIQENYSGESIMTHSVIFDVIERCKIIIKECVFENIQIDMDLSAVLYAVDSQIEIHNSIITKNMAHSAAITCIASKLVVRKSVFSHNSGKFGASIAVGRTSNLEVHNCTFTNNESRFRCRYKCLSRDIGIHY